MPVKINGTTLWLQPTTIKWSTRPEIGIDGGGHPVYPATREAELRWDFMDASGLYQLENFFNLMGNTGTLVFDLPKFGDPAYAYYSYSGATMKEPEVGVYFETYYGDVRLLVLKLIS